MIHIKISKSVIGADNDECFGKQSAAGIETNEAKGTPSALSR